MQTSIALLLSILVDVGPVLANCNHGQFSAEPDPSVRIAEGPLVISYDDTPAPLTFTLTECLDNDTCIVCGKPISDSLNESEARWEADVGQPLQQTGDSFTWTPPANWAGVAKISVAVDDMGEPISDEADAEATTTVYVIGGPIVPADDKVYYFASGGRPWLEIEAAPNQPANTQVAWTAAEDLEVVPNYDDRTPTNVRAIEGAEAGQYLVSCTYELTVGGVTGTSGPWTANISVRLPDELRLTGQQAPTNLYYDNDPPGQVFWYGFSGQTRMYRLYDDVGAPMPFVDVNEVWDDTQLSITPGVTLFKTKSDGFLNQPDQIAYAGWRQGGDLNRPAFAVMGAARQRWWAGSATAYLGVLLRTHQATWRTNGVQF